MNVTELLMVRPYFLAIQKVCYIEVDRILKTDKKYFWEWLVNTDPGHVSHDCWIQLQDVHETFQISL